MSTTAIEATEVVKKMEQNAEHNVSNLCDWTKMTPSEQKSIFDAYRNDKSNLPSIEFTYDQDGPHLKEKPGLACDGGRKLPAEQAHDTVESLRKKADNPKETISAVNKIQPEEQRQLVLKEMSEKGFPGVVIQRVGGGMYSITEDRSKEMAEAWKHRSSGNEVWDKPLATTEAARQEAAKESATAIVDTAQEAFAKPWLPLPENKRLVAQADQAEGDLHRKIAELRGDSNRAKVLAELEKQGAKVTRDEEGRPVEITFTRQLDASDPIGSVAEQAAKIMGTGTKITIPLNQSYEEMKAQKKDEFYRGAQALEGFGLISGTAQDRSAQKDTSQKFWFER
ncbi:MAG: hypothetical protein C0469_11790 [Cyanobacteria bacterium DS2.3.42]|nr:hypothetical protein [Cyanobacteria bacterium DS2.3.42]